MLRVFSKECIDSLLMPIMLLARPMWSTHKKAVAYNKVIAATSNPFTYLHDAASGTDRRAEDNSRSLKISTGHEQAKITTTSPGSTSLPKELLSRVMDFAFDSNLPSEILRLGPDIKKPPGILRVNHFLRNIALDWFHHQVLVVRDPVLLNILPSLALLRKVFKVRFDLSDMSSATLLANEYILSIWKEKSHRLAHVEISLQAPAQGRWEDFPNILCPSSKKVFVFSFIQPLITFLQDEDIEHRMHIDFEATGHHSVDPLGYNSLNWSVSERRDDIAGHILSLPDAGIEQACNAGNSPLFNAVWKGTLRAVEMLLKTKQVSVNQRCWLGLTPLGAAVMMKDLEKAKALLSDEWIVDLLLARSDINVDIVDCNNRTAIHEAIDQYGDESLHVVRALWKRAITSGGIRDSNGYTPLSLAKERGHVQIIEELSTLKE